MISPSVFSRPEEMFSNTGGDLSERYWFRALADLMNTASCANASELGAATAINKHRQH